LAVDGVALEVVDLEFVGVTHVFRMLCFRWLRKEGNVLGAVDVVMVVAS
jgi:hypothetical protein